jgi:hypothetical protein
MARINSCAPVSFDYGNRSSRDRKQVRRRQSGDSTADDGDINVFVTGKFGESWE